MNAEIVPILGKLPITFFENVGRMYSEADQAHDQLHADTVTCNAIRIAGEDELLPATLSAYLHDIGCSINRDIHEKAGVTLAIILEREYKVRLTLGMSYDEWSMVLSGIAEHRASYDGGYSSRVATIVACADRAPPTRPIDLYVRSYEYAKAHGKNHHDATRHAFKHISEKFGRDGYAKYPWLYYEVYAEQLKCIHDFIDAITLNGLIKRFKELGIHE